MRKLRIIGAASGVGAEDPGCAKGPWALHRSHAFHDIAHHHGVDWRETLYPRPGHGGSALAQVHDLCERLATDVGEALRAGAFPVVVGGDHSVAIGTWSGVRAALGVAGAPGLLWLDAHMDSHTKETSYTGNLHGMPLACLLGLGDKRLVAVGGPGPKLDPHHTVLLGVRSYEPEEAELLTRLGVRVIDGAEVERLGFGAAFDAALAIVRRAKGGFGISVDLDVFEPEQAPGVGTPEPCGLPIEPVLAGLDRLQREAGLLAMEITEYNPDRDKGGRTAALVARLVATLLKG